MKPRNKPSRKPVAVGSAAASGSSAPGSSPLAGPVAAWFLGVGLLVTALIAYWLVSHRNHAASNVNHLSTVVHPGPTAETLLRLEDMVKTNDAKACEDQGNFLVQSGRATEALAYLQRAIELEPGNSTAHYNLGSALLQTGRVDDAIAQFQLDLTLDPRDALAHGNLGNALLAKQRVDEALDHLARAVALMPGSALAHAAFANGLLQKGELDHAVDEFELALHIQPDFPPAKSRLLTIAWIWATHPADDYRNGILALRLMREMEQTSNGKDPAVLGTLAAAYAEVADYAEAVKTGNQALQLATAQTNSELVAKLREQLVFYQSDRPFRDAGATNRLQFP